MFLEYENSQYMFVLPVLYNDAFYIHFLIFIRFIDRNDPCFQEQEHSAVFH